MSDLVTWVAGLGLLVLLAALTSPVLGMGTETARRVGAGSSAANCAGYLAWLAALGLAVYVVYSAL